MRIFECITGDPRSQWLRWPDVSYPACTAPAARINGQERKKSILWQERETRGFCAQTDPKEPLRRKCQFEADKVGNTNNNKACFYLNYLLLVK